MYKQRHKEPNKQDTPIKNRQHVEYIGHRPGVMKDAGYKSGLFGWVNGHFAKNFKDNERVEKWVFDISKLKKTCFRSILSFNEEQAEGLGLYTRDDWMKYVKARSITIAREMGIDLKNFEWVAAIHHTKIEQPHAHIVYWDKSDGIQRQFVKPELVTKIRGKLIKETYPEKFQEFCEENNISQKALRTTFAQLMEQYEAYLQARPPDEYLLYKDPEKKEQLLIEQISENVQLDYSKVFPFLRTIQACMPKSGRRDYGFLPDYAKEKVDSLVDIIVNSDEHFQIALRQYVNARLNLADLYNTEETLAILEKDYFVDGKKMIANVILKSLKDIPNEEAFFDYNNPVEWSEQQEQACVDRLKENILFTLLRLCRGNSSRVHTSSRMFHGFSNDLSKEAKKEKMKEMKDRGLGVER